MRKVIMMYVGLFMISLLRSITCFFMSMGWSPYFFYLLRCVRCSPLRYFLLWKRHCVQQIQDKWYHLPVEKLRSSGFQRRPMFWAVKTSFYPQKSPWFALKDTAHLGNNHNSLYTICPIFSTAILTFVSHKFYPARICVPYFLLLSIFDVVHCALLCCRCIGKIFRNWLVFCAKF